MSNGTITQQGSFTADGNVKNIPLRADVDWFEVVNITTSTAGGADTGVDFFWRKSFADGTGLENIKTNTTDALARAWLTTGGFTRIDTSENPLAAINTTGTAISNASPPVAACASTAGIIAGDTIRIVNSVGALQFGGIDFTVGTVNTNTDMELVYAPTIATSTTFSFFKVKWQPIFTPRSRYIASISQATQAVVKLTVTHGYSVGQTVVFNVSSDYGMTQIDGLRGEIVSLPAGTNNIVVDIDTSTFTAFAWPITTDGAFTPAKVVPAGEGTIQVAAGTFAGSIVNVANLYMSLAAGTHSPAGVTDDVIHWQAGKVLDVNNE